METGDGRKSSMVRGGLWVGKTEVPGEFETGKQIGSKGIGLPVVVCVGICRKKGGLLGLK